MHLARRALVAAVASGGAWMSIGGSIGAAHAGTSVGAHASASASVSAASARAMASSSSVAPTTASSAPSAAASASSAPLAASASSAPLSDDTALPPEPVDDTAIVGSPPPKVDPEAPRARWHPHYALELEVHGSVAGFDAFGPGVGGGARLSVPIGAHFPFHRIDDDLGVGVGVDIVYFTAYAPVNGDTAATNLTVQSTYVPVYLQWNVWLGARASFFLEPTLMYRTASYVDRCTAPSCAATSRVTPTGFLGMRFRFADHIALTVRVGWPIASIGVSWL